MSLHSEQLLEHFQNPRNVGRLDTPAVTVEVINPACGDILRLAARLEAGFLHAYRWQYIVSGVQVPHFAAVLGSFVSPAQHGRIAAALAPLLEGETRMAA